MPGPTKRQLRANIWKMYLFKFLMGLHFFAGVLIPFFTDWGGITFARVMFLQSWFLIWIFLLEVPTGAVADHLGRKASLIAGAAALAAAIPVYVWKPDFRLFLLAEWFWALAHALLSGAGDALLYDSLKELGEESTSKRALARLTSFETGAIMVAAPLGSLMAQRLDLTAPMRAEFFPAAAAFLLGFTMVEPRLRTAPREMDYFMRITDGLRYLRGHAVLRGLAADMILVNVPAFMMIWLFQPFLRDLGVPIAWFGFIVTASTASQILIMNFFEELEEFAGGRRRFLTVTALIPAAAYLLLTRLTAWWAVIPLVVCVTAVGLSRRALSINYMNKHIDSERRATVLSAVSMFRQLAGAAVYPVVGWLQGRSIPTAFAALAAVLALWAWLSPVREADLRD